MSETRPPPPSAPPDNLTEQQYLAQQAHNARLAMSRVWQQTRSQLGQGANPIEWARRFPWVTVGTAAVAGFTAAAMLIPSKEQEALRRLARIERALNPPPARPAHGNGDTKTEHHGILGTILHEALAVLRPALVSLMAAGMAGSAPPDDRTQDATGPEADPEQSNGGA